MWPPGALGDASRAGRVDHRRAQALAHRREFVCCRIKQLVVGKPSLRHSITYGDETHVVLDLPDRRGHHLDVVGSGGSGLRARIVEHVRDLRAAQPEVDRHDDQARSSQPVGDLRAFDGIERHPRDTVAVAASERGEGVGDPIRLPAQGCEVKDAIAADDGRLGRQRSGVARQEIQTHGSDPRSGWGWAKASALALPSTTCCSRDRT